MSAHRTHTAWTITPLKLPWSWDAIAPALAALDLSAVFVTAVTVQFAYEWIAFDSNSPRGAVFLAATLVAGLFVSIMTVSKSYRYERMLPSSRPLESAISAWCTSMLVLFATLFATKTSEDYSRGALIVLFLTGVAAVVLTRAAGINMLMRLTEATVVFSRRTMLVGLREKIDMFAAAEHPAALGIAVVSQFQLSGSRGEQLTRELRPIIAAARRDRPDDIVLVLPWSEVDLIKECTGKLMELPVGIKLAPDALLRAFGRAETARIGEMTCLALAHPPLTSSGLWAKRVLDIGLGSLALIASAPLFALIALAIRIDSRGPVFFRQRRYGFNQQEFELIKFRSMYCDQGSGAFRQATSTDSRVTRVGRLLRRTNLDELPQLLNVLGGSMSLVGPRPHPLELDRSFLGRITRYAQRHNIKPGMTGWAQVNGLRGETSAEIQMHARVVYDIYYVENWSVGFDLFILFLTMFSRKSFQNAY